jgi:hypothetical protein
VVKAQSQEEQRMHDDLTLVLGLEGFRVTAVSERGDELDLEVELVARAGVCPGCDRPTVIVKERPVVRVRDLPLLGRRTHGSSGASGASTAQRASGASASRTPNCRPGSA